MSRRIIAELIHVWGAQSNIITLLQKQGMIQNDVSVSLKYYNMVFIWILRKTINSQYFFHFSHFVAIFIITHK